MMDARRLAAAAALAALVGACATYPRAYSPGTTAAEVIQAQGQPVAEYPAPAGAGRRLEYGGGAYGYYTYMYDFDGSDRLLKMEQVRTEANFNAIRAGMGAQEVLSRLGRPATTWAITRQRQIVWSYRYQTWFCQWFMVGMGLDDKVVDTAYGPDPRCDGDDFFPRSSHARTR